jgi:hypothetical protein
MTDNRKNIAPDLTIIRQAMQNGIEIRIEGVNNTSICYRIYAKKTPSEQTQKACAQLSLIIKHFGNGRRENGKGIRIEIDDISNISAFDVTDKCVTLTDLFFAIESMGMFNLYCGDEIQHVATLQGIKNNILSWTMENKQTITTEQTREASRVHIGGSLIVKKAPSKLPYDSCYVIDKSKGRPVAGRSNCIEIIVKFPLDYRIRFCRRLIK